MAASSVTLRLNGGSLGGGGGATEETHGKYGPIALYVGGTAAARFKDVAYADLNARPFEAEKTSANFRVHRLSEFYYSYGSAIADINRDSNPDVIAGPYLLPRAGFHGRPPVVHAWPASTRRPNIRSRPWCSSPTISQATAGRTCST